MGYPFALAGFLASLGLLLITVVELRRGFLFPAYLLRNPWFSFHPAQLVLLALAAAGTGVSYRIVRLAEARGVPRGQLSRLTRVTACVLFTLLVATLVFLYRGVPAMRILAAGKMSPGVLGLDPSRFAASQELFPVAQSPLFARPFAMAINYIAIVWGATALGVLLSGLTLSALPLFVRHDAPAGPAASLRSLIGGMLYGLPQPFCSCCAAPISASIYRSTGSLTASVAFLLTAPMLNVTTLLLAAALLPPEYAVLRIGGAAIFVPLAAWIAGRWGAAPPRADDGPAPAGVWDALYRVFNRYCRLFAFEAVREPAQSPASLVRGWMVNSWRVARVVVPVLLLGATAAGAVVTAIPNLFTNDAAGVLTASVLGTLLMIATWTEIPVAGTLISQSLTGPAAALLVTLPAVSLPCLLVLGGALRSGRVPLLLGTLTLAFGAIAGVAYL